ncbi:MAG: FAD-binding oxidoreductase [Bacteriovoracales bacterium]|nr:FAD-binding oxidoreductase [Bacteriovoracales bacterium]
MKSLMGTLTIKSLDDLAAHIKAKHPSLYFSSQTSTVIPFDRLLRSPHKNGMDLVNLSQIPGEMEWAGKNLLCRGGVTWKEAGEFCLESGREIMTYPTEELACVLAGVATSCTGERSFGYGTLRDQVVSLTTLGKEGKAIHLKKNRKLLEHSLFQDQRAKDLLKAYGDSYREYEGFKNAPFPRLETEVDLMIGLEGQLGVVTEVELQTIPKGHSRYLFFELPPWEKDDSSHLEILERVQPLRRLIRCCELIDSNGMEFLEKSLRPATGKDFIFLEILEEHFDEICERLASSLGPIGENQMYEMPVSKFQKLRMAIPRAVSEENSRRGVIKKGTDIQVRTEQMAKLMGLYRKLAGKGIPYTLFGHFGDAHLHFNFLPTAKEADACERSLESLYGEVLKMKGSPFAEHGIGLIKQKFIRPFLSDIHFEMFRYLKSTMDPLNIFFSNGYLNL